MEFVRVSYVVESVVDSAEALRLRNAGLSLREIRDQIAPGHSRMSVLRAIRRAIRNGGEVSRKEESDVA